MIKPREIYYDINIENFESTGNLIQPLRFSESRNNPIIKKAGDYSLSIVRFQLDTQGLPTYIADIEPSPNTNVNKMIETITLEYIRNGSTFTSHPHHLIWVPSNEHLPIPPAPNPLQNNSTEYYYGDSFRHYCDIINNAFEECIEDIKDKVFAGQQTDLNDLLAPKMIWNNETLSAEILVQDFYYNSKYTNQIKIFFNRALYSKFSSFPANRDYLASANKIYHLYVSDYYGSNFIDLNADNTFFGAGHARAGQDITDRFLKIKQEYSTISNWSAVTSIVFTSNSVPIYETQLSEPLVYINGISITKSIPEQNAKIISDMSTNELCYKPNLLYVPSGQNRMIDLYGDNDITNVDVNVL